MLPIECIVRGYLSGSAWKEYRTRAARCTARRSRPGCRRATSSPSPCSRPSTKSDVHDENISFDQAVDLVGEELATRARAISLELYTRGAALARERGIIIADTKFELGLVDGELVAVRRGPDARLEPVLAGRRVEARAPPRRASTSSPCATTSRGSTGTRPRRRRRSRPRSSRPRAQPLRRGLRAHHRPRRSPTGPASADRQGPRAGTTLEPMRFSVLVETRLRPGHRRSAGRHHRALAARPRLRRHPRRPGRQGDPLRRSRPTTKPPRAPTPTRCASASSSTR